MPPRQGWCRRRARKRRRFRRRSAYRAATDRRRGRACRKRPAGRLNSSGPRSNGTPNSAVRRARSARQRPGTMTRSASTGRGSRRAHDRLGHERGNFYADVDHRPCETEIAGSRRGPFPVAPGKMAGQKQDALSHRVRVCVAARRFPTLRASHDGVACEQSQPPGVLQIDVARIDLDHPLGASVSSSGAVSQAKTMAGTRHFPACANTLVTSVSEIPNTHFATVLDVAGANDQRMIDAIIEQPDRRRRSQWCRGKSARSSAA